MINENTPQSIKTPPGYQITKQGHVICNRCHSLARVRRSIDPKTIYQNLICPKCGKLKPSY